MQIRPFTAFSSYSGASGWVMPAGHTGPVTPQSYMTHPPPPSDPRLRQPPTAAVTRIGFQLPHLNPPSSSSNSAALTPASVVGDLPPYAAPPPYSVAAPAPFGGYASPPPSYDDAMKLPKPDDGNNDRQRF